MRSPRRGKVIRPPQFRGVVVPPCGPFTGTPSIEGVVILPVVRIERGGYTRPGRQRRRARHYLTAEEAGL